MPLIFGKNFWRFQLSLTHGLGFFLAFTGCRSPCPWPLLVPISIAILVSFLFRTPPFILDLAAVFLLHFLSSHFAASLNWILLLALILNAIPFLSYHVAYFLHPQEVPRPRIMALHYFIIVYIYNYCVQNLCLEWDNQEGIRGLQGRIGSALVVLGTYFILDRLLYIWAQLRRLRAVADHLGLDLE